MKNDKIYYSVGPLLYCPANKLNLSNSIIQEKLGINYSLALCLEDSINDNFVQEAEVQLLKTLRDLFLAQENQSFYMPKIFIRVREPSQVLKLYNFLGEERKIVKGFIVPKFSIDNADNYIQAISKVNEKSSEKIFLMPIYESPSIIDLRTRTGALYTLKEKISQIEELILNIRVGGNDFCHNFGFRRHANESIHQIKPVSDIFTDIITVYGTEYVVSGPVWEYYGGENWEKGLINEIHDDMLCGFTGKTVIHPNQIPVVNEAYKVLKSDYDDALAVLNWNCEKDNFVHGSCSNERMNELKTHSNWARQILWMAEVYGIREK